MNFIKQLKIKSKAGFLKKKLLFEIITKKSIYFQPLKNKACIWISGKVFWQ